MPRSSNDKLLATRGRRICVRCKSSPLLFLPCRIVDGTMSAVRCRVREVVLGRCCPLCAAAGDCCEELAISVATTISNLLNA